MYPKQLWHCPRPPRYPYAAGMANIEQYLNPGAGLLREADEDAQGWRDLVALSHLLKEQKKNGEETQYLQGKTIALIFEKTSLRTRAAFEVAAAQQGASCTYLDPGSVQMGRRESTEDMAKVLGSFYDGVVYRGSRQKTAKQLAKHADIPVWNGMTDSWFPSQALADALTIVENTGGKDLSNVVYTYVGDARGAQARSLMMSGAMLGMKVRIVAPKEMWPDKKAIKMAKRRAKESGGKVTVTDKVDAVEGSDFLATGPWLSMADPIDVWEEKIKVLLPYRVDEDLFEQAGKKTKFMHRMPADHDLKTTLGRRVYDNFGLNGVEVTDEVFSSPRSLVFEQADNRLHTAKALLVRGVGEV